MRVGLDRKSLNRQGPNRINTALSKIGLSNMDHQIITGTTSGTANTQLLVRHKFGRVPAFVLPITGNVYTYGMDSDNVDIRSTQTSIAFKIAVVSQ